MGPGDNLVAHFKQEAESFAVFGQATWHMGERWHITGGLRWTDEQKDTDLFSQTNSTAASNTLKTGSSPISPLARTPSKSSKLPAASVVASNSAAAVMSSKTVSVTCASFGSEYEIVVVGLNGFG